MKRTLLTFTLTLVALSTHPLHAADEVHLMRPAAGGGFELVGCDLATGLPLPGPTLASGLTPVTAHLNGTSALDALDPRAGSTEVLPAGGSILHLPNDAGSLLLLRRDASETRFGWWHLAADGSARKLLERPGTGVSGTDSPFLPRAAASPDGKRAMFATTHAAGGDLIVAPLDTVGPLELRTAAQAPLELHAESLLLGREFGIATHTDGALVVPTAASTQAIDVTFPGGTPAHVSGATVLSPRGERAALVAGASELATHAWIVGEAGTATCANDTPLQLDGAGHFPEAVNGPWLAVSDDGLRCAWRSTIAAKSECHAARLDLVVPAVEHLTRDANYIDTLDQIGELGFMSTISLVMGVGETLPGGGFDRVDLFEVTFETDGTFTQRNLTASSGQSVPPFTQPPAIESMQILRTAQSDRVLIYDDQGSNGQLLVVQSGISGATVALDNVRELDWVRRVGDELWFSAERDFGSNRPRHIFSVDDALAGTPTILVAGGENLLFEAPVVGSDWLAFRRELELGPVTVERVYANGARDTLIPASVGVAHGPVLLPSDHLGVIAVNPNGPRGVIVRPDGPRGWLLRTPVPAGSFLLGR